MTDGKIHIGKGFTDNVYAGRIRMTKNGIMWSGTKHDVTSDFLNLMVQFLKEKGGTMKIQDNDYDYIFTMKTESRHKNYQKEV